MPYPDLLVDYPGALRSDEDRRSAEAYDVVAQLRRDFEQRDSLYEKYDAVLFGETPVKIPEAYDKTATVVRSPMAQHITNSIVAALSVNNPVVQFQPAGFGYTASANATKREKFLMASWLRQERQAKRRLFRLFMYSLVSKGEGILKTQERCKSSWSGYSEFSSQLRARLDRDPDLDEHARDRYYNAKTEEYKRDVAPYPIATTDVPPETFYYHKGLDGFTVCAEVKDVPYLDALVRYGMALDSRGAVVPRAMGLPMPEWQRVMRGGGSTLKMVELWTCEEMNCFLVGPGQTPSQGGSRRIGRGTRAQTIRNHGYGDPYTQTLRGPYFQALGTTTACRLPHRAGLGVLFGFLDLFPLLDSMLTIAHNNAVLTGFASFKKNRPASEQALRPRRGDVANPFGEDGDEDDEDYDVIEPGYVYPDDISPLEMPKAGVEFDKFIQTIRGFLELALPSVVQGMVSGDESGYALNQAAHLARLSWDPILDNAEFALSERVGFESFLIENRVGERVYAWGETTSKTNARQKAGTMLSLGPEDTQGNHNYAIRLDPSTPSNKSLEVRLHREMVDAHFESEADAIEALGGNPDDVMRQRLYEGFIQQPEVQQRVFERAQQKLGWIDQQALEQTREQLALADQEAAAGSAPGEHLGAAGAVYAPGQGMPEQPTPQGSVTGVGPAGAALASQSAAQPAGGLPSSIPGQAPGVPSRQLPAGV